MARKIPDGIDVGRRLDLAPLASWEDALVTLARGARHERLLLVLDEYPDLAAGDPSIDTRLRAVWDEVRSDTQLTVLLCGSAVRAMEAVAEHRSPLHGRFDLRLLVHPFRPDEAALLLPGLAPADRARVWAICDGVPLYLSWWDPGLRRRGQSAEAGLRARRAAAYRGRVPAGHRRRIPATAVAVGECKWTDRVAAPPLRALLARRARALPRVAEMPRHVIGARTTVTDPGDALIVTATDIFS